MARGIRFSTLGDLQKGVQRLTRSMKGGLSADRFWSARDLIIDVYDEYHDEYDFWETLERGITVPWTSGNELNLKTATFTYSDATTSTGLTGWRAKPHRLQHVASPYRWEVKSIAQIEMYRDKYAGGNTIQQWENQGQSRNFRFGIQGYFLITVGSLTDETVTIDHFRAYTELTDQSALTTEIDFPQDLADVIVYRAAKELWADYLNTEALRNKEARRAIENKIRDFEEKIGELEEAMLERTQMPSEVVFTLQPDHYLRMFHQMEQRWEGMGSDIDRLNALWS